MSGLATVEEALAALRSGRPVLVTDDEHRENEGDVVLAAETVTAEWMAWTIRHTSGYICAPMTDDVADRLDLPLMVPDNRDPLRTAYTVTVDAAGGVTTGISAADRAHTVRTLADPASTADSLTRPGHVVPLRAKEGGVLVRPGHTEATVDLCRLAGLAPVGAIGELVNDDGTMMRLPGVLALGEEHDLPVITIEQLAAWRQRHDRVQRLAETVLPTEHGTFTVTGFRDVITGDEHLALVSPRGLGGKAPLVRLHSECLTGDMLGSQRCDCGPQLQRALQRVAAEGGVVVYLRGHEGRGVGLLAKLQAYALQDAGLDTVDAQVELGLPVDAREYAAGAAILTGLGIHAVRLLTNNPMKVNAMREHGIEVAAVERISIAPVASNATYLRTKRDRMGHDLILGAHDSGATA
ncbi:bifunctional 3,4-dihydroxy-2-butanone-4-phosphate synthase/GTP cyclohydrolase II [Knoellia sp. p5-6-4]|uniref:bifunctional 3,4-dihydroxy-2-butanone-4-phosphate synthase/GTP cyclohydrolase II n=1 Tax=unclassified Knoellia TaxID=2618719 RepID=UPI0023D99C39|nr:bifunctional 3,4-dihydroxy-2-butanone-4-phosphate synthase/GTP cyclohydrolase II [Knoellia sp. p5-6-4]MDF2145821.1 bifunctional 3,4-dihydroxy-2-butanone-4-phosphate synthase/GTP cyclohydrolase II [Knoellia sp. p5-6-4]